MPSMSSDYTKLDSGQDHCDASGASCNFNVAAQNAPVTYSRVQAIDADEKIDQPSIARANAAVSMEKPDGDPENTRKFKDYVRLWFPLTIAPGHICASHDIIVDVIF